MWRYVTSLGLGVLVLGVGMAWAGSPHFVSCGLSISEGMVCIAAKEAGLGNETQIQVTLIGSAHCQNPGGNAPSAQNKVDFVEESTEPVQNGKALYELCATPSFKPSCSPPMTVVVDTVVLFDSTNGISCTLDTEG